MILTTLLLGIQAVNPIKPPLSCEQVDLVFEGLRKEALPIPRTATDMQITAQTSLCGGWEIIDVWKTYVDVQETWHARRKKMDRGGRLTVTFTNSDECPAFFDALVKLSDIKIDLAVTNPVRRPTVSFIPPPPPSPDGTYCELRMLTARQTDGSSAQVRIAAGDGEIANWVEKDLANASTCWQPLPAS